MRRGLLERSGRDERTAIWIWGRAFQTEKIISANSEAIGAWDAQDIAGGRGGWRGQGMVGKILKMRKHHGRRALQILLGTLALMLSEMRAVWRFLARAKCDLIYKSSLTKAHSSSCVENRQL